ncbi:DUF4446 family protein [Paenibacillus roseipurpureus]|uniref:DUF4446 family protein n=1 Tax=Paenibacillus roseopurpureus TaxID=2918901 RepID=A0AA96LP14_9BACL|nr:DUF4446 family protein [Paenibacillus sp. MBLB1832]WNR44579.1 DUF4446 family protein [Paenibacillus sp. MBLB1832]
MGELFGLEAEYVMLICFGFMFVLLVYVIIISIRLSSLRKRYMRMINGASVDNMEQLLLQVQEGLNEQKAESAKASASIHSMRQMMMKMTSKVGIRRYNAFNDGGSDLSFTIAMLNEEQDGVVVTGIHSREQMYVYAKPVEKGQSSYTLSPEEREAITQTLKQS